MSNFTPLVHKEYEFEGDKVLVTMARLKRRDMLNIMPLMVEVSKATADDDSDARALSVSTMINTTLDILPDYVKSFTGLNTPDGEAVTIETVANEMYFINIATDIVTDLVEESLVLQGNAKGIKKI